MVLVMTDLVLLQMPFASLLRPSIALGLLKKYAESRQIETKVVYGNVLFANEFGLDSYVLVETCDPDMLFGDWIFSGAAFDNVHPDQSMYLQEVVKNLGRAHVARELRRQHRLLDLEKLCWALRESAAQFVNTLAETVLDMKPRMVGCTSMFDQHCASLAILKRIRELDPRIVTMLGGAGCEDPMGRATKDAFPWVDFVVSGEADDFFGDFCRAVLDKGPELRGYDLPAGIHGPVGSGDSSNVPRVLFQQMDQAAIPDFDDYFEIVQASGLTRYLEPGLPIETSRGCWWGQRHHCTFCGLNGLGMTFRSKSPERVIEELDHLAQRYDTKRFFVVDNIIDMQYFHNCLPSLSEMDDPYWLFYEVKANLKREHLELLWKAGVRWLQPGFESLHDAFLTLVDKGTTALTNIQVMKWAGELGIRLRWNVLYDAPGEVDEWFAEMASWVPFIVHLQPPGPMTRIRYQRYSPYHQSPDRFGLTLSPSKVYSYLYPVSPDVLSDLVYLFDNQETAEDPLELGDRPGLRSLASAIDEWRRMFWDPSRQRPILTMTDLGQRLLVRDTRPLASASEHILEGMDYWVYRACDRTISPQSLLRRLGEELGQPLSWSDLEPVLERLRRDALLLDIDGRFLSLALKESIRSLPEPRDHPGGCYFIAEIVRDAAPYSLAKAALRSPGDVPLKELFAPQRQ